MIVAEGTIHVDHPFHSLVVRKVNRYYTAEETALDTQLIFRRVTIIRMKNLDGNPI